MTKPWKRFLSLQFPTAALAMALIAEAVAWALSGVPMRRDRADELVLGVTGDPVNYRSVLLGDSITRNATLRFAVGEAGDVANLATNGNFGTAGEMLLLQRYLNTHRPPKYVVIALAPPMYGSIASLRIVRYNLWLTFRHPDERIFLKSWLPDIDQRDWLPAIADLQEQILDPALSWMKSFYLATRGRETAHIASGPLDPDPDAPTETAVVVASALDEAIAERLKTVPAPMNAAALRRICLLSRQDGFRVKLAWPPLVPQIEAAWIASGALPELEAHVRGIMADCHLDDFTDFNRWRTYAAASFRRDTVHLFGDGWEQRYASDLRNYLKGLPE